jgi:hypothetical protein
VRLDLVVLIAFLGGLIENGPVLVSLDLVLLIFPGFVRHFGFLLRRISVGPVERC